MTVCNYPLYYNEDTTANTNSDNCWLSVMQQGGWDIHPLAAVQLKVTGGSSYILYNDPSWWDHLLYSWVIHIK